MSSRFSAQSQKANARFFGGMDGRLNLLYIALLGVVVVLVLRLFIMMVLNHAFYLDQAARAHENFVELFPRRGTVYIQDSRTGEEFPIAMNRDHFTVFADTRKIQDDETAEDVAEELAAVFGYDDDEKFAVYLKLNKRTDPYEPLEQKVDETIIDMLREKDLPGIHFARKPYRVYPEGTLAAQVIGFVGRDDEGNDIGRYGIEGYWEEKLAGTQGFLEGERSAGGRRIPIAGTIMKPQEDGADIVLTIDRTLQFQACRILEAGMLHYEAEAASLVIMEPKTGAIRALCSVPSFDPNTYGQVSSIDVYNNSTIFEPYEPGSVFKPIAMAAALNEELVSPDTPFYDSGSVEANCTKPIKNADGQKYGDTTMTGVLEDSINTGMVHIVTLLGKERFRDYVEAFGFGVKTGLQVDTEVAGTIDSLYANKGDDVDCYTATGSFGQGLTVTPLQMVSAFGAIANGGTLMKPYLVEEVREASGKITRTKPVEVREVLSRRAAALLSGMLVKVVDAGHASGAQVEGYYVAGKTGTAQIAERGGYSEFTNHSFVGYAPASNPAYVMLVKFERPKAVRFSSYSAAPIFGSISDFVLDYYGIAPVGRED